MSPLRCYSLLMSAEVRPMRRDAQLNRERILAAAREVYAERGIDVTLDDVAERAGVGIGTVYRKYRNKDALLDELFEERVRELAELAEASSADTDAWTAFVRFLERVTELFAADRSLESFVVSDTGQQRAARAREVLRPSLERLIRRAKADGRLRRDFRHDDLSVIHAMLAAAVRQSGDSPDAWRRYFAMMIDG